MAKKLLQPYYLLAFFLIVSIVVYWGVTNTFYQQDEWQELGLIQGGFITPNPFKEFSLWQILLGEGRVLSSLVYYILFKAFPFQVWPLASLAIIFHTLNGYLVYRLSHRLSQRPILAIIAALFFLINAVASQSVIWGAAFATLPATTLILLAIGYYLNYLDGNQRRLYYWSFGMLFISLLFKEIGLFAFLFLPLLSLLYGQSASLIQKIKANALFLGYGLAILIFRFSGLALSDAKVSGFVSGSGMAMEKIIFHTILYPLTGLFQSYVPALPMYDFAELLAKIQYPYLTTTALAEIVPQTIISDMVAIIGTALVISLALWLNWREKWAQSRTILFAVLLTGLSFIPYIVLDRGGSYMDSRYYYLAMIGSGILLGYIIDSLVSRPKLKIVWSAVALIIMLALASVHLRSIRHELAFQADFAEQRKTILNTIRDTYPRLTDPTIFYVTGNRDFYIPNNKVPFQQGLGYTLMVWYFNSGNIPPTYLAEKFIWDSGTQGYRNDQGFGYGYYYDLVALQEAVNKYNLSKESIYAFHYDAEQRVLTEISPEIRSQL